MKATFDFERDALAPLLAGQGLDSVERLSERMWLFTRRRLGGDCLGPEAQRL